MSLQDAQQAATQLIGKYATNALLTLLVACGSYVGNTMQQHTTQLGQLTQKVSDLTEEVREHNLGVDATIKQALSVQAAQQRQLEDQGKELGTIRQELQNAPTPQPHGH